MLPPTDQKEGAAPGRTESRDPSQANPSGEPPLREAAPRDEAAPGDEGAPSDEAKSVDGEHEDRQTRTANGGAGSEGEQADTPNGHHGLSISQAASMHQGVNSITDTPITSPKTDEPADGNGGVVDGAASGNESCQSSANGKQQPQQPEQSNGTAGLHGKAPKTPTRKAPKKGGLVNVQRPAVKGYSIHRSPPFPLSPQLLLAPDSQV